jgi:hypothetical protein
MGPKALRKRRLLSASKGLDPKAEFKKLQTDMDNFIKREILARLTSLHSCVSSSSSFKSVRSPFHFGTQALAKYQYYKDAGASNTVFHWLRIS